MSCFLVSWSALLYVHSCCTSSCAFFAPLLPGCLGRAAKAQLRTMQDIVLAISLTRQHGFLQYRWVTRFPSPPTEQQCTVCKVTLKGTLLARRLRLRISHTTQSALSRPCKRYHSQQRTKALFHPRTAVFPRVVCSPELFTVCTTRLL